jgi:hypothetical protein
VVLVQHSFELSLCVDSGDLFINEFGKKYDFQVPAEVTVNITIVLDVTT